MKIILLVTVILTTLSCGKTKKNVVPLPERETNPYTGQVDLLRSNVTSQVFINEAEHMLTYLESKSHVPVGDGTFGCPARTIAGYQYRYSLLASGRTLMLQDARGTEYFERAQLSGSILGQWSKTEFRNGLKETTTMTFPDVRTMQLQIECRRR